MTFDERRREVLKLIREIQKERVGEGKRCLLMILEVGGADLAGFFSMGHFCFAVVDDPSEAIAATRRWPYLKVSVRSGLELGELDEIVHSVNGDDMDIVICGERIQSFPALLRVGLGAP